MTMGRTVEELAGELTKIDKVAVRQAQKQEERSAKTLDELVAIGKMRGYAKPHAWAKNYFQARESKRNTRYVRA